VVVVDWGDPTKPPALGRSASAMRGRDKLIGCAGRWGLGRDGFEISIALLPRSRGVRWASQFHTHLLSRNDSIQHPLGSPRLRPRLTSA
jgi:hypothetical protein